MEIRAGGATRASFPLDIGRRDVADHFGNDPEAEYCGFSGWVPLRSTDREILLEIVDDGGLRLPFAAVQLETAREPRKSTARGLVLMYHRIAEGSSDPWALAVAPPRFAEQMEVLRRDYSVVPLSRLDQAFAGSADSGNHLVVTFDDGYADNLFAAKPILEKREIPATVFLTTGALGTPMEFWWDELDRILLQPGSLPPRLSLQIGKDFFQWDLGLTATYGAAESARDRAWRSGRRAPGSRQLLYERLWEKLQPLADLPRRRALEALREWAGPGARARTSHRTLTSDEILELAGGLIEIGCHTVTHPSLSRLSAEAQRDEISGCAATLEEILGRKPRSFAYPFGDYDEETTRLVREAGFREAVTTAGTTFDTFCDPFRIPRIRVQDWDGDEFAGRLADICERGD